MSKKSNTLWFILGATAINIVITMICFFLLFIVYVKVLLPYLPEDTMAWALPVSFIGAIALSFVIYRQILKQITKRVNMEEHFDPLFGPRRKR